MTVKELIDKLSEYPQDSKVLVHSYEYGWDELDDTTLEEGWDTNVRSGWVGRYVLEKETEEDEPIGVVVALR